MTDFKAGVAQAQNESETPCARKEGSAQRYNNGHRNQLKVALTRQFGSNLRFKITTVIDYNPMNR